MSKTLWLFLILSFSSEIKAKGKLEVESERGVVAINFLGGQNQYQILNSDASWAGFTGLSYGAALHVNLYPLIGTSNYSLYFQSLWTNSKGNSDATQTAKQQEISYGLKFYPSKFLFFLAGLGSSINDMTTSSRSGRLKSTVTQLGLGLEYPINNNWSMGLAAVYSAGAIKKTEGDDLTTNSAIEGVNAGLSVIWSPPLTVVVQK